MSNGSVFSYSFKILSFEDVAIIANDEDIDMFNYETVDDCPIFLLL